jgi:hypothetical protein
VEWWGPDPPLADDSLLVQMEFRDPVLNQPLSPERCAREFQVQIEPETTADVTADLTQRFKDRAKKIGHSGAASIEALKPYHGNDSRR